MQDIVSECLGLVEFFGLFFGEFWGNQLVENVEATFARWACVRGPQKKNRFDFILR